MDAANPAAAKAKKKRRSITASTKLKVVEYAKQSSNRQAGREFGFDEKMVRDWRKNEAKLKEIPGNKRARRGRKCFHPKLEDDLSTWIITLREAGRSISTVAIRMKARELAERQGINNFYASPTWCYKFMRRKKFSIRTRTTVGQKLPDDWEEKMDNFKTFVKNMIERENYPMDKIGNMDEVPLTFDAPPNRTVAQTGDKSVKITTTGNEKTRFTVVLACLASGKKLKPMVIFRRITMPKEKFPTGVTVKCNRRGWMTEDLMRVWINEIWKGRPGAFFRPESMLVMDSMTAHITEGIKKECQNIKTSLGIIPGGLTSKLQPLDVGVNHVFKMHVRALWEKWMAEGIHTYTATGKQRKAPYAEVCRWVLEAWAKVSEDIVRKSFVSTFLPKPDDSSDDDNDDASSNDEDDEPAAVNIPENLLRLFQSDSEDSDFDGFSSADDTDTDSE